MRRVKLLLVMTMIMTMVFSQVATASTMFPDVSDNAWYADHVNAVADAGIIIGNTKGEFKPQGTLNADQFIKTMVVSVGYDVGNGEGYWASKYIDKARELNIIDEKEFVTQTISSQPITRAQMAKIIQRALLFLEGDYTYTKRDAIMTYIPDNDHVVSSGYKDYIYMVYERGIITGDNLGNFKPSATVTRAQASAVLHRIIDESVRKPFVESTTDTGVIYKTHEFEDKLYYGCYLNVTYPLPRQYDQLELFLSPYVNSKISDEIVKYVKEKTNFEQILDSKVWYDGDVTVRVVSKWIEDDIVVELWEYK